MKKYAFIISSFLFSVNCYAQFEEQNEISQSESGIVQVRLVDIDGDGLLDILSAARLADKISWYKNNGLGDFSEQRVISRLVDGVKSVNAYDIDDDGDLDVLSSSGYFDDTQKIAWFENDGLGNFGELQIISTVFEGEGPNDAIAADLDSDGDLDIISASSAFDKIAWYQNDGNESFGNEQFIGTPDLDSQYSGMTGDADHVESISAGDLDGDGDIDIISASLDDDKVAWYANDGLGNFGDQEVISTAGDGANYVLAVDIDADGDLDILATSHWDATLSLYENDGNGNFGNQQIITSLIENPTSVYASDLDNDGDLDIIASSFWDDLISWYENDGMGGFGAQQILSNATSNAAFVSCGDINSDGNMDVVTAAGNDDEIAWYQNDGTASFDDKQVITISLSQIREIFSADMDGDGDIDVLVASEYDDKLAWYQNDGNGDFGLQQVINNPDPDGFSAALQGDADGANSIIAADLDGDGDSDVLFSSYNDHKVAWYQNDGAGNFGSQQIITTQVEGARDVYAVDLDGDGDLEVLVGSDWDIAVSWFENDGNGNFGAQQPVDVIGAWINVVTASDLDGDGDMDLIAASEFENSLFWIQNDSGGVFDNAETIEVSGEFKDVKTADLDGDGDSDIVAIHNQLRWYENDNAQFTAHMLSSPPMNGSSIAIDDLDGDGDLDILGASSQDDKIYWFENDGLGNFSNGQLFISLADGPQSINIADIDSDGDLDIVTGSALDDELAWYESTMGGCIDSSACNFDSSVSMDNGSCCYGICDCIDPLATNYNSSADCENGTCEYYLTGLVFFDENENGEMDNDEIGLENQNVTIQPMDQLTITNSDGEFSFSDVVAGEYSISVNTSDAFPFSTTQNPMNANVSTGGAEQDLFLGLSTESLNFDLFTGIYSWANGYPCDAMSGHYIFYRNMGNVTIDGVVELEYDPLFQDYELSSEIDSVIDNHIYLSFENLTPGELQGSEVILLTPTADNIGEFLTSTARIYGHYEGNQVAYGESDLIQELTCSYDPNDKQVFPIGVSDEHYVSDDTQLEYLIRFQNTGNAAATIVTVSDTIDENLDLNTFMLFANSHDVETNINLETRVVDFIFDNIMLPDSTSDEPGSHGLVSYKIRPLETLQEETIINNTAYIYFDNNPAIVTNTTWSTIYNCDFYSSSISQNGMTLTASVGTSYQWFLNGEEINGATDQYYSIVETGNYSVAIINEQGCNILSEEIYATSISEITESTFTLSPNPMSSYSELFFGETGKEYQVIIVSSNGQLVREYEKVTDNKLLIQRNELTSGAYVLRILDTTSGKSFERKLIVE